MNTISYDVACKRRAEQVLRQHGIGDEPESIRFGERPKAKIDAIIRDIQAANAEAEEGEA